MEKVAASKVTQTMAYGGEIVIIDRIYPTLMQAVVVYRSTGKSDAVLIGSNMIGDNVREIFLPDGVDYYDHSVDAYYRKPTDKNLTGIVMNIDGNQNEMAVLLGYIRMPGEGQISSSDYDTILGTSLKLESTSEITIGTGSLSFIVNQVNGTNVFNIGDKVRAYETGTSTNFVEGLITSYKGAELIISCDTISGSGTVDNWTIENLNYQGMTGEQGEPGPIGRQGLKGDTGDRTTGSYWR